MAKKKIRHEHDAKALLFPGLTIGELMEQWKDLPPSTRPFVGWKDKNGKTISRDIYDTETHQPELLVKGVPDTITLLCHRTKAEWRAWLSKRSASNQDTEP